jgi:hypothetical protein
MSNAIKFRTYTPLPLSAEPLLEGIIPTKGIMRPGQIHVIAYGAEASDGKRNVSLHNEETNTYFMKRLTFDEFNEISTKDGVTLVRLEGF